MVRKRAHKQTKGFPVPLRLLIAGLFAVSGAAALIDQVVWTRWLNLSLGSSSYAAIVVLASFMGGLGLGSWLSGSLADRQPHRCLVFFALAEAGIGLWSFFSIPLLSRWLPALASGLGSGADSPTLPLLLRAALATGALALPTVLMGATLPLLGRWIVATGGLAGRDIGLFYTLNTLGGAAGTLVAAFWLIERVGLSRAVGVAGAADIVVALVALELSRRWTPVATSETRPSKGSSPRPGDLATTGEALRAPLLAATVGFLVSGLVGLALEVVAHRVIAVLAGSSAYAFSVMLAAFLFGIALGSFAGSRLAERTRQPGLFLVSALAGLALGVGFARRIFDGETFLAAGTLFGGSASSWGTLLTACLIALVPASLALGFVVPFIARLASLTPQRLARRFGLAYGLNTLGAVIGTILAGVWLIPRWGTATTLTVLVLLAGGASLVVVAGAVPRGSRRTGLILALVGIAGGLGLGWGSDPVRDKLLSHFRGQKILDYREGSTQTIAVVDEFNSQQLSFLRLVTNQTSLTGTHLYAKRYMRLLGHLPAIYSARSQRALVICLGTGMTAAAVAAHPQIEHLDIAEISPEVVAVAPLFHEANRGVLEDPRTRLHIDDGRHVLLASEQPWDLITLEPPPPRDSGVVSLYTTEFYELCRRRLSEGGVLAQWIPLHSQSSEEVQMLIRSMLDAFPHVLGFLPVERDLIVLGSDQPLIIETEHLEQLFSLPTVKESLGEIGFDRPVSLLSTALFGRAQLETIAGDAPAVTDDRPRVEYFFRYGRRPPLPALSRWTTDLLDLSDLVATGYDTRLIEQFQLDRRALLLLLRSAWIAETGRASQEAQMRLSAQRLRPEDPYLLWAAGISDEHLANARRQAEANPKNGSRWRKLGLLLSQRGRFPAAVEAYQAALDAAPSDAETLLQFGDLLMGPAGDPQRGREVFEQLLSVAPEHPAAAVIRRRLGSR